VFWGPGQFRRDVDYWESTSSKPVKVVKEVSHSLTCLGGQGRESLVDLPWFRNHRSNSCLELDRAVLKGRGLLGVHPFKTGKDRDVSHSLTCLGGQGRGSSVDLPWLWNRRRNTYLVSGRSEGTWIIGGPPLQNRWRLSRK
jgi:hypothetical protein